MPRIGSDAVEAWMKQTADNYVDLKEETKEMRNDIANLRKDVSNLDIRLGVLWTGASMAVAAGVSWLVSVMV